MVAVTAVLVGSFGCRPFGQISYANQQNTSQVGDLLIYNPCVCVSHYVLCYIWLFSFVLVLFCWVLCVMCSLFLVCSFPFFCGPNIVWLLLAHREVRTSKPQPKRSAAFSPERPCPVPSSAPQVMEGIMTELRREALGAPAVSELSTSHATCHDAAQHS